MRILWSLLNEAKQHYPTLGLMDLLIAGMEELLAQNRTNYG